VIQMRYFWIVNHLGRGFRFISGSALVLNRYKSVIGPFFSYREVMQVLYKWAR